MTKTMTILTLKGKFVDLVDNPTNIVNPSKNLGLNVSIRIPRAFAGLQPKDEKSPDPNFTSAIIPHDRVQPPFLDIPGYQLTFEQLVSSSSGQRVMSLYFGITPADPEILDKIPGELKAKLSLTEDVFWKDIPVQRPDGTMTAWRSITVQADQGFYWTNQGQSTPEILQGTFGLWVHEDKNHYVFIAYRFPTSSTAPAAKGLPEALVYSAGTLQIMPAAPPPQSAQP